MGAWGFVDRRIEQVLAGLDVAAQAAALCRPRRGGLAGDRPVQAPRAGTGAARRRGAGRLSEDGDDRSKSGSRRLGESVTEATVAKWLKQPGEHGRTRRAGRRTRNRQGDARSAGAGGRHARRDPGRRRRQCAGRRGARHDRRRRRGASAPHPGPLPASGERESGGDAVQSALSPRSGREATRVRGSGARPRRAGGAQARRRERRRCRGRSRRPDPADG